MRRIFAISLVLLTFALAGCTFNVARSPEGGFLVNAGIPDSVIQQAIQVALQQDLAVSAIQITLHEGYIEAAGTRPRAQGGEDTLAFELRLGASNGLPIAAISKAVLNGEPVSAEMTDRWNIQIAESIQRFAEQTPNASLESVTVTSEAVTLSLRIRNIPVTP